MAMHPELAEIMARARQRLVPPMREALSTWIEREMVLPASVADTSGRVELWPFQRGIADAFTDPLVERITLVKPTRVGFSTLLTGVVGNYCVNDPCPIIVYLPTEDDCRDYVVSDVEPIFDASPNLSGVLSGELDEHGRNTLLQRRFPGGSLKVLAAKSPRNFRRHNAKVVLFDEADAMEPTSEGNPIDLGEKRTDSFVDRKIIIGSTPVLAETSNVLRSYERSDKRAFHVPCPACGTSFEILWRHIEWQPQRPETARCVCPHCQERIEEKHKAGMVADGDWLVMAPHVAGHAGFRLNALISLLPNTTWAHLAAEWLAKHKDPDTRQVFVNTRLAEGWKEQGEELDADDLVSRLEPDLSLDVVAAWVLLLTVGVDVQNDRIEMTILGWGRPIEVPMPVQEGGRDGDSYLLPTTAVLSHEIVLGKPEDPNTWLALDDVLKRRYRHALGGEIAVSATVVDAGNWQDEVCKFCFPRAHRKVFAGKGMPGFARVTTKISPTPIKAGESTGRLIQLGVDVLKQRLFARLPLPGVIRFAEVVYSDHPDYFDELTGERKIVRYVKGQPTHRFERKSRTLRVEKLDCFVYGAAARDLLSVNWDALEERLTVTAQPKARMKLSDFAKELPR